MFSTIDTHEFVKNFIKASKSKEDSAEQQAEVIVKAFTEFQEKQCDTLATKEDIRTVKEDIRDVRKDMKILEQRLIIKIGTMLAIAVGIISWLGGIIH